MVVEQEKQHANIAGKLLSKPRMHGSDRKVIIILSYVSMCINHLVSTVAPANANCVFSTAVTVNDPLINTYHYDESSIMALW